MSSSRHPRSTSPLPSSSSTHSSELRPDERMESLRKLLERKRQRDADLARLAGRGSPTTNGDAPGGEGVGGGGSGSGNHESSKGEGDGGGDKNGAQGGNSRKRNRGVNNRLDVQDNGAWNNVGEEGGKREPSGSLPPKINFRFNGPTGNHASRGTGKETFGGGGIVNTVGAPSSKGKGHGQKDKGKAREGAPPTVPPGLSLSDAGNQQGALLEPRTWEDQYFLGRVRKDNTGNSDRRDDSMMRDRSPSGLQSSSGGEVRFTWRKGRPDMLERGPVGNHENEDDGRSTPRFGFGIARNSPFNASSGRSIDPPGGGFSARSDDTFPAGTGRGKHYGYGNMGALDDDDRALLLGSTSNISIPTLPTQAELGIPNVPPPKGKGRGKGTRGKAKATNPRSRPSATLTSSYTPEAFPPSPARVSVPGMELSTPQPSSPSPSTSARQSPDPSKGNKQQPKHDTTESLRRLLEQKRMRDREAALARSNVAANLPKEPPAPVSTSSPAPATPSPAPETSTVHPDLVPDAVGASSLPLHQPIPPDIVKNVPLEPTPAPGPSSLQESHLERMDVDALTGESNGKKAQKVSGKGKKKDKGKGKAKPKGKGKGKPNNDTSVDPTTAPLIITPARPASSGATDDLRDKGGEGEAGNAAPKLSLKAQGKQRAQATPVEVEKRVTRSVKNSLEEKEKQDRSEPERDDDPFATIPFSPATLIRLNSELDMNDTSIVEFPPPKWTIFGTKEEDESAIGKGKSKAIESPATDNSHHQSWRIVDESEMFGGGRLRASKSAALGAVGAGDGLDVSPAFWSKLHRFPEVLEKRSKRHELEQLVIERNKLRAEMDKLSNPMLAERQLRKLLGDTDWSYSDRMSADNGASAPKDKKEGKNQLEERRRQRIKELSHTLERYDELIPKDSRAASRNKHTPTKPVSVAPPPTTSMPCPKSRPPPSVASSSSKTAPKPSTGALPSLLAPQPVSSSAPPPEGRENDYMFPTSFSASASIKAVGGGKPPMIRPQSPDSEASSFGPPKKRQRVSRASSESTSVQTGYGNDFATTSSLADVSLHADAPGYSNGNKKGNNPNLPAYPLPEGTVQLAPGVRQESMRHHNIGTREFGFKTTLRDSKTGKFLNKKALEAMESQIPERPYKESERSASPSKKKPRRSDAIPTAPVSEAGSSTVDHPAGKGRPKPSILANDSFFSSASQREQALFSSAVAPDPSTVKLGGHRRSLAPLVGVRRTSARTAYVWGVKLPEMVSVLREFEPVPLRDLFGLNAQLIEGEERYTVRDLLQRRQQEHSESLPRNRTLLPPTPTLMRRVVEARPMKQESVEPQTFQSGSPSLRPPKVSPARRGRGKRRDNWRTGANIGSPELQELANRTSVPPIRRDGSGWPIRTGLPLNVRFMTPGIQAAVRKIAPPPSPSTETGFWGYLPIPPFEKWRFKSSSSASRNLLHPGPPGPSKSLPSSTHNNNHRESYSNETSRQSSRTPSPELKVYMVMNSPSEESAASRRASRTNGNPQSCGSKQESQGSEAMSLGSDDGALNEIETDSEARG